ncbi:MAG TPA: TonB-dependent receptor [Steroidobacteraceae bacterium]|nr:TonB-dependent receptor [Steroidobacteraceae bacterium]
MPDSITAFSSQTIEDARIQKFGDFAAMTPNFEFFPSASPGNFQMSIRGISQAGGNGGDAPVVMVVDGVTLPYPNSFTMPLFDIESIEVLKGPQGALYGQNAIGGAVVVTTQQPTNDFRARLTAGYGKGDEVNLTGVISGPVIPDRLLFRAAAFHHSFGGDVRYAYAPQDYENFLDDNLGRFDLKFLGSDTFTADLGVSYSKTHSGAQPLIPVTLSTGSGIPGVSTAALNNQLILGQPNQDYHTRTRRDSLDGSLRLDWNAGFADFSSVTAGTSLHENNHQDLDVSQIPFVYLVDQPVNIKAFSEELRATSPSDQRLRWNLTAFMSRVHRKIPFSIDGNLNLLLSGNTNPADKLLVPFASDDADQHLNSYAGAAQINYDILKDLELTLAGRFDHDPRSQLDQGVRLHRTFDKFQPKASISYKPGTNQTYYGTYAEGFRPGGFNPGNNPAVQPVFDPEETKTFEIGTKQSFFERKLSVSLAAYTTRYSNQQLTLVQVSSSGASQNIFTVKTSRIQGVELQAEARPLPGLDLSLGGGFQDGKIKQFGNSLSGGAFDPSSYIGKNVPLQSRYTLNGSAQYSHAVTPGFEGFIRADVSRKGRLYWYADNRVSRDPFTLVNMRGGIRNDHWEADLYGINIFGTRYYTLYFDNKFVGAPGGFDFADLADLSRYGIEVSYRF